MGKVIGKVYEKPVKKGKGNNQDNQNKSGKGNNQDKADETKENE